MAHGLYLGSSVPGEPGQEAAKTWLVSGPGEEVGRTGWPHKKDESNPNL